MKVFQVVLGIALLFSSPVFADRLWENTAIRLGSGKYIWATLDRNNGCYNMNVGSNQTHIRGNGSNCSNDVNGYWSIRACGKSNGSFRGGSQSVINEVIRLCQQRSSAKPAAKKTKRKVKKSPSASNAKSLDLITLLATRRDTLKKEIASDKLNLAKIHAADEMEKQIKDAMSKPKRVRVYNNCRESIKFAMIWRSNSGKEQAGRWTIVSSKDERGSTLTLDGKPFFADSNVASVHARTSSGKEIWAGNDKIRKWNGETSYFRKITLQGRTRYIQLCP
ncbi:hypothetical protein [Planktotalea sp.]|uniref:hypothetical protein n=1 Tax=Planktotalea sp. TaxID=2029877 RepID=UPI003D6A38F5